MDNLKKCEFRKQCIKKLKFCSKYSKLRKDKFIELELLNIIKNKKIKNLLLYLPLDMEANVKKLIIYLRKRDYKIYVPYMINKNNFIIVPYRFPLKKKKYNIYEPNYSYSFHRTKLDLAIVPIVGFDDSFRRIGFGVGFYDRYFSSLRYMPDIIFTQICTCKSKIIITQKHDIQAKCVVTNKGTIWMNKLHT